MSRQDTNHNDLLMFFRKTVAIIVERALIYDDLKGLIDSEAKNFDEYHGEAERIADELVKLVCAKKNLNKKALFEIIAKNFYTSFHASTRSGFKEFSYETFLTKINKKAYNRVIDNILSSLPVLSNEAYYLMQDFYVLNRQEFKPENKKICKTA